MLIDSHCHLADDAFAGDAEAAIARAQAAGIEGALCIVDASSVVERERARALAGRWPALRFAVGVHPHRAAEWTRRLAAVEAAVTDAAAALPGVVAVGEIGLDYHYDFAPRDVQREVFATQVALARRLGRPVVIHAREADDDVLDLLLDVGGGAVRGVFHCFTGSEATGQRVVEAGFYVGIGGIVTFPKGERIRALARALPLDRLLLETDSPYLAPVPHRGRRNEPAFVGRVAEAVAALRGITPAEVADTTGRGYATLFDVH